MAVPTTQDGGECGFARGERGRRGRSAGLKDMSIRLYPGGRHEMLNEINKEDVKQDILNWINEKLKKIG